ncbi:MobA/MobL family protein [Heyndrickxia sporothermodurans]|uniref:MobQ family relaxase n=1 Tax=Heyndrickxia sporothermodurans TaxID=46224 RepID=UPI002DBBC569|nr:MobQ family relaxase [Heyndrickxia sporothermodurans]MEB6550198.1 MobA/MobL family protein [Heyndrickxia sporothermodurans]
MSLFYLSVRNINKAKQSAVASASYKSGESLFSERDNELKSYKERTVMPETHILAPSHAPEWVYNRERLWNEVESVERNYNSRLAKEIIVALPVELDKENQSQMLLEYVKDNFVSKGMVADVSIHRDVNHNPHAHIMLTTRPFNEDGSWGNKKKKEYIFDEKGNHVLNDKGEKKYKTIALTDWDKKETLIEWRKNFADKVNEFYKLNGISETVSHESYENQGIDKLPKQRLTLEEYAIEKREKERAVQKGIDYEPVTFYAKENKEIDKANNELQRIAKEKELLSKKIVSLSEYREIRNDDLINGLRSIRKSANLSTDDWKSLKVVAKRISGFVDFNSAKSNISKLDNWKRKLEYQKGILFAEEKVLVKAQEVYKSEPNKTLLYGIIPSRFKEEFQEKVDSFKAKREENVKAINMFNELYKHSLRVVEIQKQFAIEEFNFLYPQYADKFENNDSVVEVKSKYVDLFKQEGYKRDVINEFENDLHKLSTPNVKLSKVLEEWKDVNNSLKILERTKEKRKVEYRDSYKNFDAKKTYDSSIKYTDAREQITTKEERKETLKDVLIEQLKQRYPEISIDIIKEIPSEIQSKVLQLHLNNEQSGKLSKDLETVKERYIKKDKNEIPKTNHQENSFTNNSTSSNSEMMFNSLMNAVKQQETNDYDLEAKRRKKKKPKMLYRDRDIEREM